jgi:hypothetical protein
MTLPMILAALPSMDGLVNLVVYLACVGLVVWLLFWLITYIGIPEPFSKVARVIIAVVAVVILIKVLLSIAGNG